MAKEFTKAYALRNKSNKVLWKDRLYNRRPAKSWINPPSQRDRYEIVVFEVKEVGTESYG